MHTNGALARHARIWEKAPACGTGQQCPNPCTAVLAALESVSLVVGFEEDTALEVVQEARPEIYAKGGDYDMSAWLR